MKQPHELTGDELTAYRDGFWDGNESHYAVGTYTSEMTKIYDQGYVDGKKYGPRKGEPWTIKELAMIMKT